MKKIRKSSKKLKKIKISKKEKRKNINYFLLIGTNNRLNKEITNINNGFPAL